MVSIEEFEALKKRVTDLEQIATVSLQTAQSFARQLEAHQVLYDKMPDVLNHLTKLTAAVEALQDTV